MHRRTFFTGLAALGLTPHAFGGERPWQARLLKGGFDGKQWWAGLHIALQPKWKTYWRVPGEGGIAPQIDLTGDNLGQHQLFLPLPARFEDEAGMTIGYKDDVVFPMALTPADALKPLAVGLKAFFGVCDVVCIPADHAGELAFDPARGDAPDQALISRWTARIPALTPEGPVLAARAEVRDGRTWLALEMREAVNDIFVEGQPAHYFGKPMLMRGVALLPVSGAKSADDLKGSRLRITLDAGGRGLEQSVTVI